MAPALGGLSPRNVLESLQKGVRDSVFTKELGKYNGSMPMNYTPFGFINQQFISISFGLLFVTTLFTAYWKYQNPDTAGNLATIYTTASIETVIGLAALLGIYVPLFYQIGASADSHERAWALAKPILYAHIAISFVNWGLLQLQTCTFPGQCPYPADNKEGRKFLDTVIYPTRRVLSAVAPFDTFGLNRTRYDPTSVGTGTSDSTITASTEIGGQLVGLLPYLFAILGIFGGLLSHRKLQ